MPNFASLFFTRNEGLFLLYLYAIVVSDWRESTQESSIESVEDKIREVLLEDHLRIGESFSELVSVYMSIPIGCDVVYNKSCHRCYSKVI